MASTSREIKVEVKTEDNMEDHMDKILELCTEIEGGITEKALQIAMSGVASPLERANAINRLVSLSKIELCKQGTQLLYRIKESKHKGGDDEEKIVYSIIEKVGNKGIWIRDIRFQSNLSLTQLNKVLKNMESKKLIKSVKSVAASKKKVYMLYDIEPDRSVTGGAWYSDQEYETEFIDVLNQQCLRYLMEQSSLAKSTKNDPLSRWSSSFVTSSDVCKFIKDLGISKVELSTDDIESILNTLVYDGKVESRVEVGVSSNQKLYRAVESLSKSTGLMRMPCGVCPVINDCCEGAAICPSKCVYLKEWLEL